jgi:hypothetical protein
MEKRTGDHVILNLKEYDRLKGLADNKVMPVCIAYSSWSQDEYIDYFTENELLQQTLKSNKILAHKYQIVLNQNTELEAQVSRLKTRLNTKKLPWFKKLFK